MTSSRVPQIPPLIGGLIFVEANLSLCLVACPSVEVCVMRSGLGPGRPHSLPDWFSSCLDQYSTLLYQTLFFKCSTSLHNILSNFFLTIEPDTSVRKKAHLSPHNWWLKITPPPVPSTCKTDKSKGRSKNSNWTDRTLIARSFEKSQFQFYFTPDKQWLLYHWANKHQYVHHSAVAAADKHISNIILISSNRYCIVGLISIKSNIIQQWRGLISLKSNIIYSLPGALEWWGLGVVGLVNPLLIIINVGKSLAC